MIINGAQLPSYTKAKEKLLKNGIFSDGIVLYVCSSVISALVTTIVSMPVDIVKTRIQNMNKKYIDTNAFVCIIFFLIQKLLLFLSF